MMVVGLLLALVAFPVAGFHGLAPLRPALRRPPPVTRLSAGDDGDDVKTAGSLDGARLPPAVVEIVYCARCNWMLRATWMAQELLSSFRDGSLEEVRLVPSFKDPGGDFRIQVGSSVVWDRKAGQEDTSFPEAKELKRRVRDVIMPDKDLGHCDR
eukprot:CAMPEP_0119000512 /NCGR_PEP_ID=MMETSP1173-20130426/64116_1 /TAXON_ID=1034831 /ORGANISM="Rhizochromulina marina cf, Strain CCMP1243" /LENGTH=154 /DNA_ID=CAMNT_0006952015 /DNA_START=24 /DNA_END=488 /DNA_ORIENTATION=+